MSRYSRPDRVLVRLTLLALLFEFACSRPVGVSTGEDTTQTTEVPFHDDDQLAGASVQAASRTPDFEDSKEAPPFHDTLNLPAGTLLTVRLKNAISIGKAALHQPFEASLDDSIMIGGKTLVPRGAMVSGAVESLRISKIKPDRGYVRLALESIHLEGSADIRLQTASLFVRQSPPGGNSKHGLRLEKGYRLTFRLTQPVYTPDMAARLIR